MVHFGIFHFRGVFYSLCVQNIAFIQMWYLFRFFSWHFHYFVEVNMAQACVFTVCHFYAHQTNKLLQNHHHLVFHSVTCVALMIINPCWWGFMRSVFEHTEPYSSKHTSLALFSNVWYTWANVLHTHSFYTGKWHRRELGLSCNTSGRIWVDSWLGCISVRYSYKNVEISLFRNGNIKIEINRKFVYLK